VEKIDSAIPSSVSYGPLVYFFQKKAAESGLVVQSLSLTKSSFINADSNLKEINFSINLLGQYSALKNFLASVEKSARLFEIIGINFRNSQSPGTLGSSSLLSSSSSSVGVKRTGQPPPAIKIIQTYPFQLLVKTYSY